MKSTTAKNRKVENNFQFFRFIVKNIKLIMTSDAESNFSNLYDTYSPMLYGIALEISPSPIQAEEILSAAFQKAVRQNLIQQNEHSLCATLIKLIIQTAHEQLNHKNNFKLQQFENTPLLHKILCEQINLEDHCTENKITRMEAAKQMREELQLVRIKNRIPDKNMVA